MLLGILGILLFLVSVVWLVVSLISRKGAKKPLISIVTGLVFFIIGIATSTDAEENTESDTTISEQVTTSENDIVVEESAKEENNEIDTESKEKETAATEKELTAKEWVKSQKNKNIDLVIKEYNLLKSEDIKNEVNEQAKDKETTMFGKDIEITGTAIEFLEGSNGFDKSSFIVETNDGNKVRISAKTPNEALDVGEKVEIKGSLASSLDNSDEYYVREASVYIK